VILSTAQFYKIDILIIYNKLTLYLTET